MEAVTKPRSGDPLLPARTPEKINQVHKSRCTRKPKLSERKHEVSLDMPVRSLWRILRFDLKMHLHKITVAH